MTTFLHVILVVIGYLIGSLNSAILVSGLYKKDIREEGSKNAGLTNVLRVLGKKAAILVLVSDMLKGVITTGLGYLLIKDSLSGALVAGIFTIIGHIFPIFFSFKGGKGILLSLAVILMTDWKIALIGLAIFIIIVSLTRYVSLGSIIAIFCAPLLAWLFNHTAFFIISMGFLAALTIFMHRGNIKRLINGTENKLSFKKTGNGESK
ncbi:MAG TPA: glycerol-3-phosphate 1-O-acyltransferase PlsY [Clostridia bacterium]|nr:MAG: Glycerol-3-phosphate acyltransferase [Firmicutes bacterium ADurb.Bin146]HOD93256.1 glycerol-3-phosphate 1-O-acyltransferase PlsY [Clostridia bacterium]HQM39498.1 glycerol-3-phosphate 1-O-acyltransferase PlsY [Clostridia bacterium]